MHSITTTSYCVNSSGCQMQFNNLSGNWKTIWIKSIIQRCDQPIITLSWCRWSLFLLLMLYFDTFSVDKVTNYIINIEGWKLKLYMTTFLFIDSLIDSPITNIFYNILENSLNNNIWKKTDLIHNFLAWMSDIQNKNEYWRAEFESIHLF